jgi:hypothetical protein
MAASVQEHGGQSSQGEVLLEREAHSSLLVHIQGHWQLGRDMPSTNVVAKELSTRSAPSRIGFDTSKLTGSHLHARWIIKDGKARRELMLKESNISSSVATTDSAWFVGSACLRVQWHSWLCRLTTVFWIKSLSSVFNRLSKRQVSGVPNHR